MKIFISRYALTSGILEFDTDIRESAMGEYVLLAPIPKNTTPLKFFRPEFHESYGAAKVKAEEMKYREIRKLKRKLRSLENRRF